MGQELKAWGQEAETLAQKAYDLGWVTFQTEAIEGPDGRGGWRQPIRQEYRGSGSKRKINRARGGGAKAQWFSEYQKLQIHNPRMAKNDITAIIGPCLANQTVFKLGS